MLKILEIAALAWPLVVIALMVFSVLQVRKVDGWAQTKAKGRLGLLLRGTGQSRGDAVVLRRARFGFAALMVVIALPAGVFAPLRKQILAEAVRKAESTRPGPAQVELMEHARFSTEYDEEGRVVGIRIVQFAEGNLHWDLHAGDLIVAAAGEAIDSPEDAAHLLSDLSEGKVVKATVKRADGRIRVVEVAWRR